MVLSNSHYLLCCDIAIEGDAKNIASFFGRPPLFHQHLISHFLCLLQLVLTMPVQGDDARLFIGASHPSLNAVVALEPTRRLRLFRDLSFHSAKKALLVETVPLRL